MLFLTAYLLLHPQTSPASAIRPATGCSPSKDLTGFRALQVHVGNEEFMHLRVFKSLPHENEQLSLHSYQASKTKHDELTYF